MWLGYSEISLQLINDLLLLETKYYLSRYTALEVTFMATFVKPYFEVSGTMY